MKTIRQIGVTLAALGGLLVAPMGAVADSGPSGGVFGQHVRHCAQTMGLSGSHNPGMHHGYAGWDGMACPD